MLICYSEGLNTSPVEDVLDQAQFHLKDHKGKRHQVYSNLTDISLLQSFDMNLWSHLKLNPARPHFPTAP